MSDPFASWTVPPLDKTLHNDEVHVWLAAYKTFRAQLSELQNLLSVDEAKKAARFYFEKDRERFIVTHGLLRKLLASYINTPPVQLDFQYNAYGKPALASSFQKELLHFNLSHTQNLVVYAFTCTRNIGIDIEYMRADIEYEQIAGRYFSPFEHAELQRLPSSQRQQAFFHCWTRKEAYIKARGLGLSLALDSFDVTVRSEAPVKLVANRENAQETTRWRFAALPMNSNYAGTVVVEGQNWQMRCWQLLPSTL
jgi:4'-phosphopantetheinyl transferase